MTHCCRARDGRVESLRTANVVWLRELFLKMSPNPQARRPTAQASRMCTVCPRLRGALRHSAATRCGAAVCRVRGRRRDADAEACRTQNESRTRAAAGCLRHAPRPARMVRARSLRPSTASAYVHVACVPADAVGRQHAPRTLRGLESRASHV